MEKNKKLHLSDVRYTIIVFSLARCRYFQQSPIEKKKKSINNNDIIRGATIK